MNIPDWAAAWRNFRTWFLHRFHDGEVLDLWMGANVETWQGMDGYAREARSDDDRNRHGEKSGEC